MDLSVRGTAIDLHIGGRIRSGRKAANMTLRELACRVGLTFQQIHKYELGLSRVSVAKLLEVSQVLAIPVTEFFDGLPPGP